MMNRTIKTASLAAVAIMAMSTFSLGQSRLNSSEADQDTPRPVPLVAAAAPQANPAASQPGVNSSATQPADADKIKALIAKWSDDDFKVREQASRDLKAMGPSVLPAMKQAKNSPDPEVASRAEGIINDLENPPKPKEEADNQPPQVQIQGGRLVIRGGGMVFNQVAVHGGAGQVAVQINGNMMAEDSTVTQNGRTLHLHKDATGLKFSVTENGKSTEYAATDEADLKKKAPEAYKEYEKVFGNNGGNNMMLQIMPPPAGAINQKGQGGVGQGMSGGQGEGGASGGAASTQPNQQEGK